ncbi:hypothetical protein SGLAM104S_09380 [Streptomyces glaucescens]
MKIKPAVATFLLLAPLTACGTPRPVTAPR